MTALISVLPVVATVLAMGIGTLAAIGRAATPEAERTPLRSWGWRGLVASVAIGRREWALALAAGRRRTSDHRERHPSRRGLDARDAAP